MKFFSKHTTSRGFTIVEMIVVVAIFFILTAIILINYRGFGSDLLLTNLSYDIALSLRKAQSYGVAVKSTTANFQHAYGVHFVPGTEYFLFVDNDDNAKYTVGTDTLIEEYLITNRNRIVDICYQSTSSAGEQCFNPSSGTNPASVAILFKRPDPDAIITQCPSSSSTCSPSSIANAVSSGGNAVAKIKLRSVRGIERTVTIRDTGEISVK